MNAMTLVLVVMASFLLGSANSAQSAKCRPDCNVDDIFDPTCRRDRDACLAKGVFNKIVAAAMYPLCMTTGFLALGCSAITWRAYVGQTGPEYAYNVGKMIVDDKKKQG